MVKKKIVLCKHKFVHAEGFTNNIRFCVKCCKVIEEELI